MFWLVKICFWACWWCFWILVMSKIHRLPAKVDASCEGGSDFVLTNFPKAPEMKIQ